MFIALKGTYFCILFAFTAAGVVQCGGCKTSPRTSTIVQFIFHFWSFELSERILRNQKLTIGLDSYVFLLLSLHGHYRVTDEDLIYETTKYGPSTFFRMCSLLLKELIFCILLVANKKSIYSNYSKNTRVE